MNFPVNAIKATQAVARLISSSGGPIDYLRAVKLIYLADRASILKRGIPIVGGQYFSMRRGPTIGEVMDFVSMRNAPGWKETISPRHGHEIRLQDAPNWDALSGFELHLLDEIVTAHRTRTTDELVQWCHDNCSEYEEVQGSKRKPISVEAILKSEGKTEARVKRVVKEAESLTALDELLA